MMIPAFIIIMLVVLTLGSVHGVSDSPNFYRQAEDVYYYWRTEHGCISVYSRLQGSSDQSTRQCNGSLSPCDRQTILNLRGGGGAKPSPRGNIIRAESSRITSEQSAKKSSAATEGWKSSIASGLASVCAKTLLQPFDTIKTVQQQQHSQQGSLSLIQAMQMVVEREGDWKDLYAGLTVSALGSIPSISLYYGIYSYCKRDLFSRMLEAKQQQQQSKEKATKKSGDTPTAGSHQALKLLAVALSAGIGNTVASFSRVPYEVVKQRLQMGEFSNTMDALVSMFHAKKGLRAFFPPGGIAIQMLRDVPYAIVTLLVYEYLRDVWKAEQQDRQVIWKDMAIGAIAGGTGSFLTNGLDVLKTRLQISPPEVYGGSIVKCARATFQEGGIAIFFRGSTSRLMHKMPANAFFFYFFEFFRTLLKVDRSSLLLLLVQQQQPASSSQGSTNTKVTR